MDKNFQTLAPKYFLEEGFSCSESIVKSAYELGLVPKELINAATSFSGGMGSGCLCGAIAGSQMVLGYLHGKYQDNTVRALAKEFYQRFIKIHKVTCCKILTKDYKDFHSSERKKHCSNMVFDCAKILDEMLAEIKINV